MTSNPFKGLRAISILSLPAPDTHSLGPALRQSGIEQRQFQELSWQTTTV